MDVPPQAKGGMDGVRRRGPGGASPRMARPRIEKLARHHGDGAGCRLEGSQLSGHHGIRGVEARAWASVGCDFSGGEAYVATETGAGLRRASKPSLGDFGRHGWRV